MGRTERRTDTDTDKRKDRMTDRHKDRQTEERNDKWTVTGNTQCLRWLLRMHENWMSSIVSCAFHQGRFVFTQYICKFISKIELYFVWQAQCWYQKYLVIMHPLNIIAIFQFWPCFVTLTSEILIFTSLFVSSTDLQSENLKY